MKISQNYFNYNFSKLHDNSGNSLKNSSLKPELQAYSAIPVYDIAFFANSRKYYKEIKEIEAKLFKMGIDAYLQDKCDYKNYVIANSLHQAFLDIKTAGYHIYKGTEVHLDEPDMFEGSNDKAFIDVSRSTNDKPIIYFNSEIYNVSKKLPYGVHKGCEDKPHIYNSKMDVYHEYAHYCQARKNKDFYFLISNEQFPKNICDEIEKKFDIATTRTKAEFVAESFAYKLAGIDVESDTVDFERLYKENKGLLPRKSTN